MTMQTFRNTIVPDAMRHDELLEILNGIRATVVLAQVAVQYTLRLDQFAGAIRGKQFQVRVNEEPGRPGYALSLDELADLVANPDTRGILGRNVNLLMKQDLVRTAYEHVAHYCEEHQCFALMKAQSWWMFARVVRNTISHKTGARLYRWPADAPATVTWRGHTISKMDVGKDILFDADEAFYLFDEIVDFARRLPQ
jgi:hypothetical protein